MTEINVSSENMKCLHIIYCYAYFITEVVLRFFYTTLCFYSCRFVPSIYPESGWKETSKLYMAIAYNVLEIWWNFLGFPIAATITVFIFFLLYLYISSLIQDMFHIFLNVWTITDKDMREQTDGPTDRQTKSQTLLYIIDVYNNLCKLMLTYDVLHSDSPRVNSLVFQFRVVLLFTGNPRN